MRVALSAAATIPPPRELCSPRPSMSMSLHTCTRALSVVRIVFTHVRRLARWPGAPLRAPAWLRLGGSRRTISSACGCPAPVQLMQRLYIFVLVTATDPRRRSRHCSSGGTRGGWAAAVGGRVIPSFWRGVDYCCVVSCARIIPRSSDDYGLSDEARAAAVGGVCGGAAACGGKKRSHSKRVYIS